VIRCDLPRGVQAAQVAHAAGAFGPHPPETHVVILAVPDESTLKALSTKMAAAGLPHKLVDEPDEPWGGQAMAIGCSLTSDRTQVRKVVSQLPLLR
jgi:hypothetical protein